MTNIRLLAGLGTAMLLGVTAATTADTITKADGTTVDSVTVTAVAEDAVQFRAVVKDAPAQSLPLNQVKKIVFTAPAVVSKPGGIVLVNGTRLSGEIRSMNPKITCRTTALGLMELENKQVGLAYFSDTMLVRTPPQPVPPFPFVLDTFGNAITGKLMTGNSETVMIKTADGLKKLQAASMAYVQFNAYKADRSLVLRNGDVLNGTRTYQGDKITVNVGPVTGPITLASVAEINF